MRKVRFLLALSALLVISIVIILIICLRRPSPQTFKVLLNGPIVIVRTPDKPNVITAFSPRDPDGLHAFFPNRLLDGIPQTKDGTTQAVHITLLPDGLKPASDWSIDPYYPKELFVDTQTWKRPSAEDTTKDYFVTIELPLPEKITFAPPLNPVTFADGTHSFMATNFVLEYKVTDYSKIHAISHGLNNLSPISSAALEEQYATLCSKPDVRQRYYQSCIEIRNLLEQCAGARTAVFFFGVGIPVEETLKQPSRYLEAHAVDFFNKVILQSFPEWKGPTLAPKGAFAPQYSGDSTAMLMETSFRPGAPRPRLLPVNAFTAVIDCKAGNVIVTAHTTQQ
jgi:hypothetical protein